MKATLRFIGEGLEPIEVSQALGLIADESGRIGDPIVAHLSRGRTVSRPATAGFWFRAVSGSEPTEIHQSLTELFASSKADRLSWARLAVSLHGELTVHEAPPGDAATLLGPELVEELASRGVVVSLNRG